jgi:hypothetical protein
MVDWEILERVRAASESFKAPPCSVSLVKTSGRCLRSDMIWFESRPPIWIGDVSTAGLAPLPEGPVVEEELGPFEADRAGS